ncbi:MAG: Clp protease ClpP [Streptomyces sp.]|nr:Clp protease ClpP [Streptomyces sp.]
MSSKHTRRGFLAAHHLAAKAGIPVPPHVAAGPTADQPQAGDQGRDRPWYKISDAADDEAELLLYDDIGGWFGTYAEDFDTDLKAVTAKKLTVRVNSPGGSVFEGMAIASMLRAHPADITVRVDGIAASIASVIAMAGDRVVMMPGATMMIHDASGMCLGDAADMAKMAELLDLLSNNIADIYAAKAGGTRDEWRTKMRAESWYLAQEAVDAGLADEVAAPDRTEPQEPEMRKAWDLKAYGYTGPEQPADAPAGSPALTIDVGALLGEAFVEQIRAAVLKAVPAAAPADAACPSHNTAVEDGTWDAGTNQKRLGTPIPVATVKKMYATYDDDRVEDGSIPKDAAHLPHHFVAEDGTPGAASVAGVRNALSRLPQTQGLTDTERSAAEKHLQAHLDRYQREHSSDDHVHDEPAAAEPADDWAADMAHLTAQPADDWAADLTHLTGPDASSSAATAA